MVDIKYQRYLEYKILNSSPALPVFCAETLNCLKPAHSLAFTQGVGLNSRVCCVLDSLPQWKIKNGKWEIEITLPHQPTFLGQEYFVSGANLIIFHFQFSIFNLLRGGVKNA